MLGNPVGATTAASEEADALRRACTNFLTGHGPRHPHAALQELAAQVDPDLDADRYGVGGPITPFEEEVATLLGKEAALFLPSGTLAQQVALRIHADQRGRRAVAMHPKNHLDRNEQFGYQHLHNLHPVHVGDPDRLLTLADLEQVATPLAALLIELPQREIGGQLPPWDDLVAQTTWARERGAACHMDGARLWESGPFYARPYDEIAALFDTVYVSFYKGLGGIAGATLAGPAALIAEARVWQRRHGGNLIHLYPYVLSARHGLHTRLGQMPDYCAKAQQIAAALTQVSGLSVLPRPPQSNMFHLLFTGDPQRLRAAALELAADTGVWTFERFAAGPLPDQVRVEFTVGDATLALSADEIAGLLALLVSRGQG